MDIDDDDTEWDDSGRYFYKGELVTGEVIETDGAGHIIALTTVRSGLANGPDLRFYPDGTLKQESSIVNGGIVGVSRGWYPTGQLAEERVFDGDRLVEIRRWAEDGTPKHEEPRV